MNSIPNLSLTPHSSWLRFWAVLAAAWLLMLALAPASGLESHLVVSIAKQELHSAIVAWLGWFAPLSVAVAIVGLLSLRNKMPVAAWSRLLLAMVLTGLVGIVGSLFLHPQDIERALQSVSSFSLLPLVFLRAPAAPCLLRWTSAAAILIGAALAAVTLTNTPSQLLISAGCGLIFSVVLCTRSVAIGETSHSSVLAAALACAIPAVLINAPLYAQAVDSSLSLAIALSAIFALAAFLLLLPLIKLMPAWGWRVVLALYLLVGAVCNAFVLLYGTIMDPSMLRNALATDVREVRELVSFTLVQSAVGLWLPTLAVVFAVPAVRTQKFLLKKFLAQSAAVVVLIAAVAAVVLSQMSAGSSFFRNSPRARFDLLPIAVFVNFSKTFISDSSPQSTKKSLIDPQPQLVAAPSGTRPLLVVFVVGETGRAVNWSLGGYSRNTNPQLTSLGVTYFSDVTSCGTSTDVSVPCMFSRPGRRHYDRKKIISQETVLSILHRAGIDVRWVENQSGDKGVAGPSLQEKVIADEKDCRKGVCMDMAMVNSVKAAVQKAQTGDARQLLVLHSMGSHGPAYWLRSDETPFGPGCRSEDLGSCSRQAVIDAYDNSIAYTDKFLASVIRQLQQAKNTDVVFLYVADHGESLGEKGLWLHGAPWIFAPAEQIHVPMVLWMNQSAKQRFGIDESKVKNLASRSLSHDNLFDTLLSLLGVKSSVYDADLDLLAQMQSAPARK